jgi:hypothetical protein
MSNEPSTLIAELKESPTQKLRAFVLAASATADAVRPGRRALSVKSCVRPRRLGTWRGALASWDEAPAPVSAAVVPQPLPYRFARHRAA